jgi:signal peptidase
MDADRETDRDSSPDGVRWLLETERTDVVVFRETLLAAGAVLFVGALLFAASGVWPPMVAVESGSMQPELYRGDLVFVVEEHRFVPAAAGTTGVVPYRAGKKRSYRRVGDYGDVVVYRPNGDAGRKPVIHRARFWVNDSENWYEKANPAHLPGDSCEAIPNCPAPHAGFVTMGDANDRYDQVNGISRPVRPAWVRGTAELRIPELGHVRLEIEGLVAGAASR